MKTFLKKNLFAFFILIAFCFSSCSRKQKNENSFTDKNKITVGFSIDTLAIERWQRDLDVFMATVRSLNADVIVQNAGNSVEEQKRQLMYLMERNVNAIVILPKDAESLKDEVEKIRAKNIPVIAYDRLIRNTNVDLYISVDSTKVGSLMAEKMKSITGTKNWICILGPKEDFNMTMIQNGIQSSIKNHGPVITDVFYTEGWDYDLAKQKMVDIITNGIIPDAIICGNDAVADAVLSVLHVYYPDRHIPVCGQDADIAACQNITHGFQDFTIYKPITLLAEKAAEYAVRIGKGESAESIAATGATIDNGYAQIPCILLEPEVVTKENIDRVIIDSGFHTHSEVYME
ncbi:MAG: substrate-binding domain-containing protein [Treponema sp.]|nr:substrate-binding domain-containing protein [Spirochaetia bacterium]MDD7459272.1 substrate-binding domain-containing protein [Spirochaetales bacterium]MDY5811318.1 substrate-binding domain-containing protein [Treponema sp.]MEE1181819.1 substrate-binding domain-containing protein [Treponema sp.]